MSIPERLGRLSVNLLRENLETEGSVTSIKWNEFNDHFATISSKLASNISTSDSDNYLKYLTNTDKQFQL